ncbi:MAG: efflux RND transporter periplasmic adaptor subunit [Rhodocyclaceae bacterium]
MNNNRHAVARFPRAAALAGAAILVILSLLPPALPAEESPRSMPPAASVELRALKALIVYPQRDAAATVIARNESKLAAEVAGTVLRWNADTGASVRRGDVLAEIDPADYRLALDRARSAAEASAARLKLAEAQLRRSQSLVEKGFISQEALSQKETEVALMRAERASNRAQQATAERQLAKTRLRAPFDAEVRERKGQVGETVAAGTVLYVLAEAGASELAASVSPADAAGLGAARTLRFELQGGRGGQVVQHYPLRLLRLGATLSPTARTQEARFAFAGEMPPAGSDGRLVWSDPQPHLPAAVVVRRASGLGIFVADAAQGNKVARFVPLPDAQEARVAAVPAGLVESTQIIVGGQAALQDGMAIRVVGAK